MWNCSLNESVIREIPAFQFTKGAKSEEYQSVYGCMICLTEFQEHDILKVLPYCSHAFHLDCIDIWLQTNANCPLCRSHISGNTHCPFDNIIAPSSSSQGSQLLANMVSDEDFVFIELGRDHGGALPHVQQERNDSTMKVEHHQKINGNLKPRRCLHVSIMGDECIDVRKKEEKQFSLQPIRRSFSMDSANDRRVYFDVQAIIEQTRHQYEAGASEDCNNKQRTSFFPFCYGKGSKSAVLPSENYV